MRDAIAGGADALAMAGGDGSQAIVAERELPYACIPAGTRNHFALDLGVNRDDVVGALDAFLDGGEKRVDLAEVNGPATRIAAPAECSLPPGPLHDVMSRESELVERARLRAHGSQPAAGDPSFNGRLRISSPWRAARSRRPPRARGSETL